MALSDCKWVNLGCSWGGGEVQQPELDLGDVENVLDAP